MKVAWFGWFDELKDRVENSTMLEGKLSGQSETCRLFETESIDIGWYLKTNTITIKDDY